MFLTYGDLAMLFPNVKGIQDEKLLFHTVAASSDAAQPKGIFIPIENGTGELKEALKNGAIAALWKEGEKVPSYTPNYFPVFFTNDLVKGIKDIMELYIEKISALEKIESEMTNFLFLDEKRLKEDNSTYDIAVMAEKLSILAEEKKQEGRG